MFLQRNLILCQCQSRAPKPEPMVKSPVEQKPTSVIVTHEENDGKAIGAGVFALVLLAAGTLVGFLLGRHTAPTATVVAPNYQITVPPQPTVALPTPTPQVLGITVGNPQPTPIQPTPTQPPAPTQVQPVALLDSQTFSDPAEQFTFQVPSDWKASNVDGEDVFVTPQGQRASVQMYQVGNNDFVALGSFLSNQPNLHDVVQSTFAGRPAYAFNVDGIYVHGYAFLDSGRLYYVLGAGVESSPLAATFQTTQN